MHKSKTLQKETFALRNDDGWQLSLVRTLDPRRLERTRRPVLIVPGYGMNSFIFGFHPSGRSLIDYLAEDGFEVWSVDLRAQGEAISLGGGLRFGLEDLALVDLPIAVTGVLARTESTHERVDMIGASLGATLMFMFATMGEPGGAALGSLVSLGGPVKWVRVHPLLRAVFGSPSIIGSIPFVGSRTLARLALPRVARFAPGLLSIYLNPAITDVRAADQMVRTVENPNRHINRQIAEWMIGRDLWVRGQNLSDALERITHPLLCVVASHDGIVPEETALYALDRVRSRERHILRCGRDGLEMAHADLFVSSVAEDEVFAPLAQWLRTPDRAPRG